jgi:hypothetical protein
MNHNYLFLLLLLSISCSTFRGVKKSEIFDLNSSLKIKITDKSTYLNSKPEGKSFLNLLGISSEGVDSVSLSFTDSSMILNYQYSLSNGQNSNEIKGLFKDGFFEYETGYQENYFGGNKKEKQIVSVGLKQDHEIMVSIKKIKAKGLFILRASASETKTHFFKSSKTKRKAILFVP